LFLKNRGKVLVNKSIKVIEDLDQNIKSLLQVKLEFEKRIEAAFVQANEHQY